MSLEMLLRYVSYGFEITLSKELFQAVHPELGRTVHSCVPDPDNMEMEFGWLMNSMSAVMPLLYRREHESDPTRKTF